MLCKYCGTLLNELDSVPPFPSTCPKCAGIIPPVLVRHQGDGVDGFREIMIRQNANEPRRKLNETQSFHFIIFMGDDGRVEGFDLEDWNPAHLFQWRRGRKPAFYGVLNIGRGYHNHDELFANGIFDSTAVIKELQTCGQNVRSDVLATLIAGINDYREKA